MLIDILSSTFWVNLHTFISLMLCACDEVVYFNPFQSPGSVEGISLDDLKNIGISK